MVRKVCVFLLLLSIVMIATGCRKNEEFWCDGCHVQYYGVPHYVLIESVDLTLCEACYEEYLQDRSSGIGLPKGIPTLQYLNGRGDLIEKQCFPKCVHTRVHNPCIGNCGVWRKSI